VAAAGSIKQNGDKFMKVCIAQPEYSIDYSRSDELFEKQLKLFSQCDDSMDIIVFPEACDIPCLAKTKDDAEKSAEKYNERLLELASATAKRCNSLLFINARSKTEKGLRNTTYAFDRNGKIAGTYDKQHLTPGEVAVMKLDSEYSFVFSEPTVIEIEGIRFGFLVCYDA
jgi:predicted amidohydrolase